MFDAQTQKRFWSKVQIGPDSECWLWLGAFYSDNGRTRGRFYALGRMFTASQVATIIAHGSKPDGLSHLHSCDNPMCCNPAHLRWGTHAENMAEMAQRGRGTIKEVCARGHSLDGENLRYLKRGGRECRACQDIRKAAYLERKRNNG